MDIKRPFEVGICHKLGVKVGCSKGAIFWKFTHLHLGIWSGWILSVCKDGITCVLMIVSLRFGEVGLWEVIQGRWWTHWAVPEKKDLYDHVQENYDDTLMREIDQQQWCKYDNDLLYDGCLAIVQSSLEGFRDLRFDQMFNVCIYSLLSMISSK